MTIYQIITLKHQKEVQYTMKSRTTIHFIPHKTHSKILSEHHKYSLKNSIPTNPLSILITITKQYHIWIMITLITKTIQTLKYHTTNQHQPNMHLVCQHLLLLLILHNFNIKTIISKFQEVKSQSHPITQVFAISHNQWELFHWMMTV